MAQSFISSSAKQAKHVTAQPMLALNRFSCLFRMPWIGLALDIFRFTVDSLRLALNAAGPAPAQRARGVRDLIKSSQVQIRKKTCQCWIYVKSFQSKSLTSLKGSRSSGSQWLLSRHNKAPEPNLVLLPQ